MGYLQAAKQRIGAAAKTLGRHAATVGKVALGAAAVAGAAYHAYQTHGEVQTRRGATHSAHGGGGGLGGFLGAIPGTASLELLREAQAERRIGVRR
jgi:hypothetical protein